MSDSGYRVWIDQDLCTGDGICVEIAPALFAMHDDGLAYVKESEWPDIYNGDGTEDRTLHGGPSSHLACLVLAMASTRYGAAPRVVPKAA